MGNSCEYFVYGAPQTPITTFLTPTINLPSESASVGGGQWEVAEQRRLGACRDVDDVELGARLAGGSLLTEWFDTGIAKLFKTFMTDATTSGGAGAYVHGLLYDDSTDLNFFSAQLYYKSTLGLSVLAGIVSSWELNAVKKERAKLTFNWEAKDVAESSSNSSGDGLVWNYNTAVNTPNLVVPTGLTTPSGRGLWFYDATVQRSGTFTFNPTIQRMVQAGSPVALSTLSSLKVAVNHNLDTDGFFLTTDRTRGAFCPQNREIKLTLEFDWCDQAVTLWRLANLGIPVTLKATFLKTANLGVELYFPAVFMSPFALPNVAGDKAKRTYTVEATAEAVNVTNTTSGVTKMAINMVVLNTEATI